MKFEISLKRLVDIMCDEQLSELAKEDCMALSVLYSYGSYGCLEDQEPTAEIADTVRKFLEDE
jgi:hypothetical protein